MRKYEQDKAVASGFSLSQSFGMALAAGMVVFLGILMLAREAEASNAIAGTRLQPQPSGEMLRNAEDVLQHFHELVCLARGRQGPVLSARMAEVIRNSLGGEKKREAVDRYLDYMERILQDGHPSIQPPMAVQRVMEVIFFPGVSVRPTYGVERVEQILDTVLDECPNRKARFEAVNGLLQIAFVQPNRREEIIEVLYQLRTAEEMAQDYPPQDVDPNARSRGLNRIDETIEMIQSFLLNEVGGAECISDDEYVALQKLSKSELLERVRRGPLNDYALSYLMKNGCDDEELKYLFQLATKKRGHAAIKILSSISVTLLKPLEERTGTEADRHRLAAYVNMLEEARASSEPEDSGAWVQILTQELMRIAESDARPGEGNG